jgi:ABC-type nitrate/sulfonate/bicarbonate transport system, permease component
MSSDHILYLRKIKRNKYIILFFQFFLLISLLFIWQYLTDKEIINSFISSSPIKVYNTIISLHNSGNLYNHIWVTAYEIIISFILSMTIGILVSMTLWWYDSLAKVLEPYLTVLNSLPKVALGPILLIWCGANIKTIIFMAILVSIIVAITNIYQGFMSADTNKIKLIKSFGGTKRQLFWYLILPNSYKYIISTLKLNISMCLIGVIMGEFLVSKEGIGYLIMNGSQVFNLNLVISGIILLGIIATMFYIAVCLIEKMIIRKKR